MGFGFSSSATFFFSSVTSDFAEERPDLSSLFVNRGGEGVNVAAQANDEGHRLARRFRAGARVGEEVRHDLVMTVCTSSWSISTGKKRPAYLRRYSTRYLEI